jgi:23S rRNA pseudouridine2605 synthase
VRRYRARAYGHTTQARLDALKDGVTVEGVAYGPIEARLDKVQTKPGDGTKAAANLWITVSLNEGKNREVRRVLESIGLKVNRLIRLAYGPFALGTLPIGAAEEVGPRVIREQLAGFIAPQNMPRGERRAATLAPAPSPQRRAAPSTGHPRGSGGPGSSRDQKRSSGKATGKQKSLEPRLRGDERKNEEGETQAYGRTLLAPKTLPGRGPRPRTISAEAKTAEAREKKVYKQGWAKPKPKVRPAAPPGAKPKRRGPPKAR